MRKNAEFLEPASLRNACILAAPFVTMLAACSSEPMSPDAPADQTVPNAVVGSAMIEPRVQLEPHELFDIGDPSRTAQPPSVRFVHDHWVVAWVGAGKGASGYQLEAADVDTDGNVSSRRASPMLLGPEYWVAQLSIDASGRLGVLTTNVICTHTVVTADLQSSLPLFHVGCDTTGSGAEAAAAPIDGSDDWLVAFGDPSNPEQIVASRYRPNAGSWTAQFMKLGTTQYPPVSVFAWGDDALVAWSDRSGSTLKIVQQLAQRNITEPFVANERLLLRGRSGGYAFAALRDRGLLFGTDGRQLWAASLTHTSVVNEALVVKTRIIDRAPSAVAADPFDAVGVCYAMGTGPASGDGDNLDGVGFVVVNARGQPMAEPVLVASGLQNIGGCAVGWSGSDFLVAYWAIKFGNVPSDTDISLIRGRRITLQP